MNMAINNEINMIHENNEKVIISIFSDIIFASLKYEVLRLHGLITPSNLPGTSIAPSSKTIEMLNPKILPRV
jgi:hypothetical protein